MSHWMSQAQARRLVNDVRDYCAQNTSSQLTFETVINPGTAKEFDLGNALFRVYTTVFPDPGDDTIMKADQDKDKEVQRRLILSLQGCGVTGIKLINNTQRENPQFGSVILAPVDLTPIKYLTRRERLDRDRERIDKATKKSQETRARRAALAESTKKSREQTQDSPLRNVPPMSLANARSKYVEFVLKFGGPAQLLYASRSIDEIKPPRNHEKPVAHITLGPHVLNVASFQAMKRTLVKAGELDPDTFVPSGKLGDSLSAKLKDFAR